MRGSRFTITALVAIAACGGLVFEPRVDPHAGSHDASVDERAAERDPKPVAPGDGQGFTDAAPAAPWTRLGPSHSPSGSIDAAPATSDWPGAKMRAAMAYDARADRIFLVGGSLGYAEMDVWEWSFAGAAWTNRTPAPRPVSWPAATWLMASAFDPVRQKLLLLSRPPTGDLGYGFELWELDLGTLTWKTRAASTSPDGPPRCSQCLVSFDHDRDRLVMTTSGSGPFYSTDTWEWNPVTGDWTRVAQVPWWLWQGDLVYDSARKKTVWVGVRDNALDEPLLVMEWNGASWLTPSLSPTSPAPSGRTDLRAVFHEARGEIMILGGMFRKNVDGSLDDLWAYDPSKRTWREVLPSHPPPWPGPRQTYSVTYDSTRKELVLYGGVQHELIPNPWLEDMWSGPRE